MSGRDDELIKFMSGIGQRERSYVLRQIIREYILKNDSLGSVMVTSHNKYQIEPPVLMESTKLSDVDIKELNNKLDSMF